MDASTTCYMGEVNSQMLSSIISNNLIIFKRLAVVDLFLVYSKTQKNLHSCFCDTFYITCILCITMLINIQLCTATLMNELSVCCTFQELKMLSTLTFLQLLMHISIEWEGTTLFISICTHLV